MTTLAKTTRFPYFPTLFNDFFDDDTFFNKNWFNKLPAANIEETENDFKIELAVPGMKKDDFHIELENGMLNIWCEKEDTKEEMEKNYSRKEFNYTKFNRAFRLPEYLNTEKIDARYKDGILNIMLPKMEEAKRNWHKEIAIK